MKIQDIHAIYINLEKDKIKDKRMKKILNKLGINFTRQDAVYGKELENVKYRDYIAEQFGVLPSQMSVEFWSNRSNFKTMTKYKSSLLPKVGAFLSHTLALKKAIDMKLNKVLILEDDIDPQTNIHNSFTIPKNTDIFYLGGSFWKKNDLVDTKTAHIPIDGDLLKMVGGFAYVIPTREKIIEIYNVLMSVFNQGKAHDKHKDWRTGVPKMRAQAIDLAYVNHFQKNGNCYILNPVSISHIELGSNIANNRSKYKISHFLTTEQQKLSKSLFD